MLLFSIDYEFLTAGGVLDLINKPHMYIFHDILNDYQARARSAGLRAGSARAFTGRRNSHSGRGEDFLTGQQDFFTETAVTPERKVEKSFPRWEINRHVEG